MTIEEQAILTKLIDGEKLLVHPVSERIKDLCKRGYCELVPAVEPIFHAKTGEFFAKLTEAGRIAVEGTRDPNPLDQASGTGAG